ncbi:MAG: histidinol-phosphate transaminase [Actinobacteria bacterium]|nr:histidinol-phosphate transaminase [Actinomycetota bacterium]
MTRPRPRADLRELAGYHSPQLEVTVRLNTNESPYPPPAAFTDAWLAGMRDLPLHRYPDRSAQQLRTAIARRMGRHADEVFAANGSNEVLQTLLLTYGGVGRRALVFEPTYPLHAHLARITGTGILRGSRTDELSVDAAAAVELIAREQPELVFLCSPNNPSGTVEARETVEAVLAAAPGVVIVDEAYGEFARWSAAELVSDKRALVVVRTYSKVWSLAALRLGFCVAPAWLVAELEKVVLPYHLDAAKQVAGVVALDFVSEMDARVSLLVEERERMLVALEEQPGVTVFPSGANFFLFRVHGDGHAVWQGLLERGILVRDFSAWPGVDECLRVTVGTPAENDAFLSGLAAVVREHGAS